MSLEAENERLKAGQAAYRKEVWDLEDRILDLRAALMEIAADLDVELSVGGKIPTMTPERIRAILGERKGA